MRNINTIICRVKCGLPITQEEEQFAKRFLDKKLKEQKIVPFVAIGIVLSILILVELLT